MPSAEIRRPKVLAAVAAVAALAFALPVAAQSQAPATEFETLSTQLGHDIMAATDFRGAMVRAVPAAFEGKLNEFKSRPEWAGMLEQAAVEEIDHDLPAYERMVGLAMTKGFSIEDLRATMAFFRQPGGKALLTMMADGAADRPLTKPSREASKGLQRFFATPAGRKLEARLGEVEAVLAPLQQDIAVELVPGMFRRFADKAEAGELARRAAALPAGG